MGFLLKYRRGAFLKIARIGIEPSMSRVDVARISFLNILALVSGLLVLAFAAVNAFMGLWFQVFAEVIIAGASFLTWLLVHKRRHRLAAVYWINGATLFVVVLSVTNYQNGRFAETENIMLGLMVVAFLLRWRGSHIQYWGMLGVLLALKYYKHSFETAAITDEPTALFVVENNIAIAVLIFLALKYFLSMLTSAMEDLAATAANLAAANKELEAFSYSVSHDLRAPLRHIDGVLHLFKARTSATLDDKSRHYMDTISNTAKRMGTLIDDLLAFSRMKRCEIQASDIDLGVLVQEVIRECEHETEGRNISWHIGELPPVTGDAAMLRMVLVNLISNAVKFTKNVERAEIAIASKPGSETETVVFVRDNGAGFDMRHADRLFDVFQRLHSKDEFDGTGIGLANVRRIIGRHGGRTWAEGQVNQGATFYFSLPHSRTIGMRSQ